MFLLNNLANTLYENSIDLFRNDGLALFKNIIIHSADKVRKEFHKLFKNNGSSLEIKCNLEIENYLDITLDLNNGTYKRYCKPNNETLYIHAKSNHPANILKQLPVSIETRLSFPASIPEIFYDTSKHYRIILNQSWY